MKKVRFIALSIVLIIIGTLFVGCKKEEAAQIITLIDKLEKENSTYYWLEFRTKELVRADSAALYSYDGTKENCVDLSSLYVSKIIIDSNRIGSPLGVSSFIPSNTSVYFYFYVPNELKQCLLKVEIVCYNYKKQLEENYCGDTVEYWLN